MSQMLLSGARPGQIVLKKAFATCEGLGSFQLANAFVRATWACVGQTLEAT